MNAIIDSSFILDFLLPDEHTPKVLEAFDKHQQGNITLLSSALLPFEVANGLRYAAKSKRIGENDAYSLFQTFLDLGIELLDVKIEKTLEVAFEKDMSIYDASYAWLAKEKRLNLLTLDRKLKSSV